MTCDQLPYKMTYLLRHFYRPSKGLKISITVKEIIYFICFFKRGCIYIFLFYFFGLVYFICSKYNINNCDLKLQIQKPLNASFELMLMD